MAHARARRLRRLACFTLLLFHFSLRVCAACSNVRYTPAVCVLLLMVDGFNLSRCHYRWYRLMLFLDIDVNVRCFQVGRVLLSVIEIDLVAWCWCWCWCRMFPTCLGVAVDGGLKCYFYRCSALMMMVTGHRWLAVVGGTFCTMLSMLCGGPCVCLLLFHLVNSKLFQSVIDLGAFVQSFCLWFWLAAQSGQTLRTCGCDTFCVLHFARLLFRYNPSFIWSSLSSCRFRLVLTFS